MKGNTQGVLEDNFYPTTIFIPAFTRQKKGMLLSLSLKAKSSQHNLEIQTIGSLAQGFEKIFYRTIFILSSLKKSWNCLNNFHFVLQSTDNFLTLKDARSASLPLCISLLEVLKQREGVAPLNQLVGTGILRQDGSIEESSAEEQKKHVAKNFFSNNKQFISSKNCDHVFKLEKLLSEFH